MKQTVKSVRELYLAALKGDWESVEDMSKIQREITIKGNHSSYCCCGKQGGICKKLLNKMKDDKLEALNTKGNTALCYAAATGNVNIAQLMLKKIQTWQT
jgi:hypothetical protein